MYEDEIIVKEQKNCYAMTLLVFGVILAGMNGTWCLAAESNYEFTVGGEDLSIPCDFEDGEDFNLVTVNTQFDMEVVFENASAFTDVTITIDGVEMDGNDSWAIGVESIDANTQIEVVITEGAICNSGLWDFKSHTIYNEETGEYDLYYSYHSADKDPQGIFTPCRN